MDIALVLCAVEGAVHQQLCCHSQYPQGTAHLSMFGSLYGHLQPSPYLFFPK